MSNNISIFHDLVDFGYHLIPTRGKIPLIKFADIRSRKTTHDDVDAWLSHFGVCNFALVTGKETGIVVVDADSEYAIDHCERTLHFTPFRVRTKRGMHYIMRHPGFKVTSRRVVDDPGIDVKGDGGLVTAVGSTHESGFVYHLDDGADIVAPSDLPFYQKAWFPEKVLPLPKRTNSDRADRAQRYLDKIPAAGAGARNSQAYRAAASSVRDFGLDYETGLAMMLEWNQRQDPPLPESEIRTIVGSALRSGRYPVGVKD